MIHPSICYRDYNGIYLHCSLNALDRNMEHGLDSGVAIQSSEMSYTYAADLKASSNTYLQYI
jgi:hypothetical protein